MKFLLTALLLAAIAGLQFFHELSYVDAPGGACMAPADKAAEIRDALLAHLKNH